MFCLGFLSNIPESFYLDFTTVCTLFSCSLIGFSLLFLFWQPIGLTVRTLMRMQLNIAVKNPSDTFNLQPIKHDTILPMAWIEMVIIFFHLMKVFGVRWKGVIEILENEEQRFKESGAQAHSCGGY